MKTSNLVILPFLFFLLYSCTGNKSINSFTTMEIPVAKKLPKTLQIHNDQRIDNYFWMRLSDEQKNAETPDAQTQDVLNYLNAENEYLKQAMSHTESFQQSLYDEMVSRVKKDDQSVPVTNNGYSYYARFEEGDDYRMYCRKKIGSDKEEILLNGPKMAKGYSYYGIGSRNVSPNNNVLAYGIDTVSRRRYTIYLKDLKTGKLLKDKLSNTTGNVTWANDNKTIFYSTKDPETLRSNKIWSHKIGTSQSADKLIYEEKDDTFRTGIYKSKSKKYLFIYSAQTLSTEIRFLNADDPNGEFKIIQARERNLEYYVDHFGLHFYIRTNLDAENFKLIKTPVTHTEKENWIDVVPHQQDIFFSDFDLFKDYLVVSERVNGLVNIRIQRWSGEEHQLKFNDPAYLARSTANLDFDTDILRFFYSSMTTPGSTFEYNMNSKERTLLKQTEVLDPNFKPENYISERLFASSEDGTKIPISIVYKKGLKKDGNSPLLLTGYGSYGNSRDATFSNSRLSLLDRGFVFAIAHIRGGQEMGKYWYEEGKLLNKINTFTDFIACGKFLIEENFTSSDHLYARGGSAGGLLMGAVLNMEPKLWKGVVAAVPFVDVVSTMLDESIPLTTFEFDEWGNPKDEEYYHYIKSYSPYDNVEAKEYPNILITTGYWDSQVQYWEPAKWIAKLRELKTDDNLLIMDCNMDVGHGGASGRFEAYKQTALTYAFLLDLEGIKR